MNAYFEAVSGFTATGATVLTDVEALGRAMLFWRQFSHWLGGMGIIVLAVAILPRLRIGGRRLLESELAGPTEIERFTETIRETARRLWTLYAGLTVAAILALALMGWTGLDPAMTLFDAVSHAVSVIALGAMALLIDARSTGSEVAVLEAIGASAACIGNVGAAFGFAGPFGSYEPFSDLSTGILSLLMWLGRVEIVPVAALLSRSYAGQVSRRGRAG